MDIPWHMLVKRGKVFVFLLLTLVACSNGSGTQRPTSAAFSQVTATPTLPQVAKTRVYFPTSDHLQLAGWLYQKGASTAIICSHQLAGTSADWESAAPWLAAHGFMTLTYDFRGAGESGGQFDAQKFDLDLLAALAFLHSQGAKKVILLGASLGATESLRIAAQTQVAGVIAISTGYGAFLHGQLILDKAIIKAITAPKLFIASKDDTGPETQAMFNDASTPKNLHIYPGETHGVALFETKNGPDLLVRILAFVNQYAPLN